MASKRRGAGNGRQGGRVGARGTSVGQRIEHLRRSFGKFRRAHRPRTRIPQDLREEALEALRCGAAELDVRRACRVTLEQLEWWRRRSAGEAIAELDERAIRVFPVVDEEPEEAVASVVNESAAAPATQHIELRIGGWAICIRPVEA